MLHQILCASGIKTSRKWLLRGTVRSCYASPPHTGFATFRTWCKSSRGESRLMTLWKWWPAPQVKWNILVCQWFSTYIIIRKWQPEIETAVLTLTFSLCVQAVWTAVARWRPPLARTLRSSCGRWRSSTRRSAPCCQRTTRAWRSSTRPGCTAWGRRGPKSCCTPTITLWRRWQTASPWSGEQHLCYHWLATCTKRPNRPKARQCLCFSSGWTEPHDYRFYACQRYLLPHQWGHTSTEKCSSHCCRFFFTPVFLFKMWVDWTQM